jgi:hypothetical protein
MYLISFPYWRNRHFAGQYTLRAEPAVVRYLVDEMQRRGWLSRPGWRDAQGQPTTPQGAEVVPDSVVTLDPTLVNALKQAANKQGLTVEALALKTLRERFLTWESLGEPRDEWERRLRRMATDCGVSLSDEAVSSEGIYD